VLRGNNKVGTAVIAAVEAAIEAVVSLSSPFLLLRLMAGLLLPAVMGAAVLGLAPLMRHHPFRAFASGMASS
jgi:hypothetical protein